MRKLFLIAGCLYASTCFADMQALLQQCAPDVGAKTMAAIIAHESGGNPYAILDNGYAGLPRNQRVLRRYTPRSREEATATALALISQGHIVDLGLGQINNRNLAHVGLNLNTVFEPCANLRGASQILKENYRNAMRQYGEGQMALLAAISAYNTGNSLDGFRNGYVGSVIKASYAPTPELKVPNISVRMVHAPKATHKRVRQRLASTLDEAEQAPSQVTGFALAPEKSNSKK